MSLSLEIVYSESITSREDTMKEHAVVTLLPEGGERVVESHPNKTRAIRALRRLRRDKPSLLHTIRLVEKGA